MARQIGTFLRLATLCVMAALIAACAPVESPRLGSGPPVLSPKTLRTMSKPAPADAVVTFALDPITNAPGEMIYAYEDALKAKAPSRQLKILEAGDPTADYQLKAYLSAVGDYNSSLVLYVVDIFDRTGTRIHRISGQIKAGGSQSRPMVDHPWRRCRRRRRPGIDRRIGQLGAQLSFAEISARRPSARRERSGSCGRVDGDLPAALPVLRASAPADARSIARPCRVRGQAAAAGDFAATG